IPNEEEVITTLTLVLTPVGGGATKTLKFQDLDGDGPQAPIYSVDTLEASKNYTGTITLLNELESPAENITEEVEEEGTDHQFFYGIGTGLNLTVTYADLDADNRPIG